MKKYSILFLLFLFAIQSTILYGQDSLFVTNDSINILLQDSDTTHVGKRKHKKHKHKHGKSKLNLRKWGTEDNKDRLVSSIFGEGKRLSNADSIVRKLDDMPAFGIYKDNLIITGTELFQTPTQWNSDAKFQVSIRHRLTNSVLPFKTYLYLAYTQKAFWDIYKESFPFRDLNYNPGIGIGRAIIYKNRLLGYTSLMFEHESNGKDGIDSRSWNKVTFGTSFIIHDNWTLDTEIWIPMIDGESNKDLTSYAGWANMSVEYMSPNRKFVFGGSLTKRAGKFFNTNVTLNAAIRLTSNSNQFLFVEFYNGYGESLLDYKQFRSRLRGGIVIKPDFLNLF